MENKGNAEWVYDEKHVYSKSHHVSVVFTITER